MRRNSLLAYAAVVITSGLAVWAGCGSDESTATPGDGDGGASSSGGSSGATSSSGAASSSGGSSSGGTNDGGDGGGSSSGGSADGGIDPPDAGPGGDTTKLTCGSASCALPAQQCCIADLPGQGNRSYGCAPTAGDAGCPPPDGGGGGGGIDVTSLKCSGAANCPANTKCCVRQTNGGAASECKADCNGNEAQLCDPNAATDGCPQQDPCSNDNIGDWGLSNAYGTCGGQGT